MKGADKGNNLIKGNHGVQARRASIQANNGRIILRLHEIRNMLIGLGLNTNWYRVNKKDNFHSDEVHGELIGKNVLFCTIRKDYRFDEEL